MNKINIFSPSTLSAISMLVFALNFFIDPNFYTSVLFEENYLYLNLDLLTYGFAAWLSFLFGLLISQKAFHIKQRRQIDGPNSIKLVKILLLSVFLLNIIIMYFLNSSVGVSNIISINSASEISKTRLLVNDSLAESKLGWTTSFVPIIWVVITYLIYTHFPLFKKTIVTPIALSLIIFQIGLFLLMQNKGPIVNVVSMCSLTIMVAGLKAKKITIKQIFIYIFLLLVIFLIVFYILQSRRLGGSISFLEQLMGYISASYNRSALIIGGESVVPNQGSSFYAFQGFWTFPFISQIFDFLAIGRTWGLNLPESDFVNWQESFISVGRAGLNSQYIWVGIFGYIYADLGWFGLIWFLAYGVVSSIAWKALKSDSLLGIAYYPFVFTTLIGWYALPNIIGRESIISLMCSFFILIILSFISKLRRPDTKSVTYG